jgi:hypothetical protein
VPKRPFGSIESRHGVDEPDYVPPRTTAEKLEDTGAKMQATGEKMASCGGSIIALGCSGFVLVVIVLIVIALLSGGGGSSGSTPTTSSEPASSEPAKTNCEHPSAAEPCSGKALEEWHREHGETPLRVQEGKEAPDEQEQEAREAKEKKAEAEDEAIREGQRLKNEAAGEPESG